MDEHVVPQLTLPATTVKSDETGLFCIDGDHTLIDGHTHNRIYSACVLSKIIEENGGNEANVDHVLDIIKAKMRSGELRQQPEKDWKSLFYTLMENDTWERVRTDKDTQWELVNHLPPIGGDPERWKSLFLNLIEEGHSVAIVSFSKYGEHILPRYLHEVIGLDQDFITQHICIVSRLTPDQSTKEGHIAEAKEKTGRTHLLPEKIVFCDDDITVVENTCRKNRYIPVYADEDGEHIKVLFNICLSLKNPNPPSLPRSPSPSPRREASPSPRYASPLSSIKDSPTRVHIRRSPSQDCGLQNSGEYNNDPLRNSSDGVRIN